MLVFNWVASGEWGRHVGLLLQLVHVAEGAEVGEEFGGLVVGVGGGRGGGPGRAVAGLALNGVGGVE